MGHSGYTCVRITFCSLNVIFWLAGCAILGVGIWLHLSYGGYAKLMPSYSALSADSLCIAAGVITFVIAFLGYCGSWFQNRCLLVTYIVLVCVMFCLELTAGTLVFVYRHDVSSVIRDEFKSGIKMKYLGEDEHGLTTTWDHFQTEFKCCGVVSYSDWYRSDAWPKQDWVPDSCCHENAQNITLCGRQGEPELFYEKGCLEQLHLWLIMRLHIIGFILFGFIFVQLFGLTSSFILCFTLRRRRRRHKL